jgi:hypothetical protein
MLDVNALYEDLKAYIAELGGKFVDGYIPADPGSPPDTYSHDVKAYCILSHAAFEEFIEGIALGVIDYATNQWLSPQRKVTDVIIALLCWYGAKIKIDENENSPETKPFDYLRPLIDNAKATFSAEVSKNHGVSIVYLRNLLIPVAIEITQDVNQLNSLKKLAEGRGAYAHKGRGKSVLGPEDAKRYVHDVLTLCDGVRAKALVKITQLT